MAPTAIPKPLTGKRLSRGTSVAAMLYCNLFDIYIESKERWFDGLCLNFVQSELTAPQTISRNRTMTFRKLLYLYVSGRVSLMSHGLKIRRGQPRGGCPPPGTRILKHLLSHWSLLSERSICLVAGLVAVRISDSYRNLFPRTRHRGGTGLGSQAFDSRVMRSPDAQ
jgi:hypothetical protein